MASAKVIDNEGNTKAVNFPQLIDPGMPDYANAKLRWRFDGLSWNGGWVSKPAGILRRLFQDSKAKHLLKYQTYELVLDETNQGSPIKTRTEKKEILTTMVNEIDELKTPAVATPKAKPSAKVVAKPAAKTTKPVAKAQPVNKTNGEFVVRPGSHNEKLIKALQGGKVVTREALGKLIGPSLVGTYTAGLIKKGFKIKVLEDGAKFQMGK